MSPKESFERLVSRVHMALMVVEDKLPLWSKEAQRDLAIKLVDITERSDDVQYLTASIDHIELNT